MKWGKGVNVYRLPPIDFMWGTLPTISEYNKRLVDEFDAPEVASQISALDDFLKSSLETAKQYGWEGDFRIELVCPRKSGPVFELVPAPIMELRHGQESQA